jgi:uncharacterized membrane protein YkvA (DUF1232 family)
VSRSWKERAAAVRLEGHALLLAARDPRTPRLARALVWSLAAYALSPIDLIPDFIPILGHLDDVVIVGAGLWIARRMIPETVLSECRERARSKAAEGKGAGMDRGGAQA